MSGEIPNVMIDPSLLSSEERLTRTLELMRQQKGQFQFWVAQKFLEHLVSPDAIGSEVLQFFGGEWPTKEFNPLPSLAENSDLYSRFVPTDEQAQRHDDFRRALGELGLGQDLADVIFQEWVFLREKSFLVAGLRRVFETFRDAGAGLLEVSEKVFKEAVSKELHKEVGKLTRMDYLRALGKWAGSYVGPTAAVVATSPILALILEGVMRGVIFIRDP